MADYFASLEREAPEEVTTPDGAVWRLRQPRGRDFDQWMGLYLLVLGPAASKLIGTSQQDVLAMEPGPEKAAAVDAALLKLQEEEWKGLDDAEKERRRALMDERDAALVAACVTHCTPPGGTEPIPVRVTIPGGIAPPEGARRPQFWNMPLGVRRALVNASRLLVSGKEVRQQVDTFDLDPTRAEEIHRMSKDYGQLPNVFRHLSQEDLNFCVAVWRAGVAAEMEPVQRAHAGGAQVTIDARDLR